MWLNVSLVVPAVAVLTGLAMSACSSSRPAEIPLGETLSDMKPVTVAATPAPVPGIAPDQIEKHYRSALEVATDPEIRRRILIRLADMEMARSERRQQQEEGQKPYFKNAIALYQRLLANNDEKALQQATSITPASGPVTRERLLYQLAKAYALDGREQESAEVLYSLAEEYPNGYFSAEADFRLAEIAFIDGDYKKAEQLYDRVLAAGQTPFFSNAIYMHGWSLFRQDRYRDSLRSFTAVLDDLLSGGIAAEQLHDSQQHLFSDTLRIMAIAFSYLDGAQTLAEMYAGAEPPYLYTIYQELGNLYLEKERFRDSADTFLLYARLYPDSDYAPQLSARAIDVYDQASFPSLVRPAKEIYVRNYGINSHYWGRRGVIQQDPLLPYLYQYLDELASYHHARAQKLQSSGSVNDDRVRRHYLQAASYYQEFITTFPMDGFVPGMTFLMAEAYTSAGELLDALLAYEQVAYLYQDPKRGAEAAYAVLLTLESLAETADTEERAHWSGVKTQRAIDFAEHYAEDPRVPEALADAAEDLFEQGDLKQALEVATRLTEWQSPLAPAIQKTAWLVRGHSLFDLEIYSAAEEAYRETLPLTTSEKEGQQVTELIAAAMYRQAEGQLAQGNKVAAADQLLAIAKVAPGSKVAIASQYDAANHLMELQEWERAAQVLEEFARHYPQSELAASLPPKLTEIYQATGEWGKAAKAASTMARNEEDPNVQRNALYLAAELYEKNGNKNQAIVHYRQYAHTYPEPLDLATEARFRLVELYQLSNQPIKRNFWLQKLIDAHAQAEKSNDSSDRMRYLAAFAARELAKGDFYAFQNIKLTLPLEQNLQRKKTAMEKTLKAYQRVLDYGIGEFATEASNRIGMVYAQLSRDLMESERPSDLDALELEQYELLLEEQAFPFEEKAIEILAANAERSWDGVYDQWVKQSFDALAKLLPARYGKRENRLEVSSAIY